MEKSEERLFAVTAAEAIISGEWWPTKIRILECSIAKIVWTYNVRKFTNFDKEK